MINRRRVMPYFDRENLLNSPIITDYFLNTKAEETQSTMNVLFTKKIVPMNPTSTYTIKWDDLRMGTVASGPSIRICFFDANKKFISPRTLIQPKTTGAGRSIFKPPVNAKYIDIRIDSTMSPTISCFTNLVLYKDYVEKGRSFDRIYPLINS